MKTIKTQTMNKTGTSDSDLRTLKKNMRFKVQTQNAGSTTKDHDVYNSSLLMESHKGSYCSYTEVSS